MVFSSGVFLFAFLPLVLMAYFIVPGRKAKNYILLLFSLFFYAWGEPVYVFLMLFSIAANWMLVIIFNNLKNRGSKRLSGLFFAFSVVLNIILLGYYKYFDFIIVNINSIFGLDLPQKNLPLPIGISFFTFQALSYVIDAWRGTIRVQKNPLYLGMYITMFPQLIAGPIVRYETVEAEIDNRKESPEGFANGFRRFIIGLGKKAILANTMGYIADSIINSPVKDYGMAEAWYAIIAYSFQIYFDFSGYSDMAIGLGKVFGFNFLENFNYPYISRTITEFWRRWHISLSSFFRDYVYIPLGGNRVKLYRWLLNIMIVWFLTGLWHGAEWNFVLWGLYFGVILIIEKLFLAKILDRLPAAVSHAYAIVLIVLGWVFFRIENIGQIRDFLLNLSGANGFKGTGINLRSLNLLQFWPWFIVSAVGSTPAPAVIARRIVKTRTGAWAGDVVFLALFGWCIVSIVTGSFNPFIYFRF